jgi:hypothetical protein
MRCEEEKTIIQPETIMKKINEPAIAKTSSLLPEFIACPSPGTCVRSQAFPADRLVLLVSLLPSKLAFIHEIKHL